MPTKPDNKILDIVSEYCKSGDEFDAGCSPEKQKVMIEVCRTISTTKPVCIISHWEWWDLNVPKKIREKIELDCSIKLAVIKSDYVIWDELGRFDVGDWVRTSSLINFTENCIFETKNTFYILVGSGTRKTVNPEMVFSLF